MNDINLKYNLQLEPMKMHFAVLPGGLKFMRVLWKFSNLVLREKISALGQHTSLPTPEQILIEIAALQRQQQQAAVHIE